LYLNRISINREAITWKTKFLTLNKLKVGPWRHDNIFKFKTTATHLNVEWSQNGHLLVPTVTRNIKLNLTTDYSSILYVWKHVLAYVCQSRYYCILRTILTKKYEFLKIRSLPGAEFKTTVLYILFRPYAWQMTEAPPPPRRFKECGNLIYVWHPSHDTETVMNI